jgi:phosphatidylglycerophosphatase A
MITLKKSTAPPSSFLLAHPAHLIACGFGSGLAPVAPGTFGTLFAWASYPLLRLAVPSDLGCVVVLVLLFALGTWCCQITGRHLGVIDHGSIVWDEIVPFWMVLLFLPPAIEAAASGSYLSINGFLWQMAGFLWFRFYDIVKPAPARWFDTQVKNGFGVMMDDLVAAGYTVLTLALCKALFDRLA